MDDDKLSQIDRLFALKEKGVLSDSEFQSEKDKILGRVTSPNVSQDVSDQSNPEPAQANWNRDDAASAIEWEDDSPRNARKFIVIAMAVLLVFGFGYWTYGTFLSQPDDTEMSSTSKLASETSDRQKGLIKLSDLPSKAADAKAPPKSELLGKTKMVEQDSLQELTESDLSWRDGGASCRAQNAAGKTVLYTEGKAAIRFKGQLRTLEEEGIGGGPFTSEDGSDDSLIVEIAERSGPRKEDYEKVSYPAYLKVFDGAWVSVPVTMTCES